MKIQTIQEELIEAAGKIGVGVRKESGKFRGGLCSINDEPVIVLNKSAPIEVSTSILAQSLLKLDLAGVYLKPAVRDYLETEANKRKDEKDFELEISDNPY